MTDAKPRIGRPPKVDEHGVPTRTRLLEAGTRAFSENGFEATTLADIAQRAEISAPAIYNHFGSKEELFVAVAQWLLSRLRDSADPEDDPHETIDRYLRHDHVEARRFIVELHLVASRNRRVADMLADWHSRETARRVELGRGPAANIKVLFLMVIGLGHLDAMDGIDVPDDELRAALHRAVDGLFDT